MKQLIGQREADKRIEKSSKKSIVKQMEKKRKDTEKKSVMAREEMLALRYRKLLDNKQIAVQVGKNEKTVDRQIGITPKFVLVGRMSREEAVYYHCHWGHSLVETAKANGLNIYAYLQHLLLYMLGSEWQQNPEELDQLMPWSQEVQEQCK